MNQRIRFATLSGTFAALLLAPLQAQEDPAIPPPQAQQEALTADERAKEPENEEGKSLPRRRRSSDLFRLGSDARIEADERAGDSCVVFGDLTVEGEVRDLVVVGGNVKVTGLVDGELVVVLGTVELGPSARVKGEVVIVGGRLDADPSAKIEGNPIVISKEEIAAKWEEVGREVPFIGGLGNWVGSGLILGRPLPHQGGWWWWAALGCAVIYLLTAVLFNGPITASVDALEMRPVGSFLMGVLMFILFGPLLLLLAATGIGLVVVPFVICAGVIGFLFGKVTVYRFVGAQFGKQTGIGTLQLPLVALIVGMAVLYAVYMIPVLGLLVWGVMAPLGFGAVTLACFGAFRKERRNPSAGGSELLTASVEPATAPPPVIPGASIPLTDADRAVLPKAGFWIRLLATFLDLLLVGAVSLVVQVPPFFLLAWVVYHVAMWTWKGTTLGGLVLGIRIVRRDGRPIDFAIALIRSLASFFSALVLFLGFFWAGWTREKLAWHDMIAGTVLVKVPKGTLL